MADKRISQLIERTDIANNDVLPIVASGATTTNKVTISTIQDWMQDNLDVGVTSVGITLGTTGTDVNVSGSPITTSGNITINIPDASATARGVVTTGSQVFGGVKTFANGLSLPSAGGSNQVTRIVNIGTLHEGSANLNQIGFNSANNIYFGKGLSNGGVLQWTNAAVRYYTLPDADGTLALASDLTGYVTLGTAQTITGQKTFSTSGSSDTAIINHGSGSGIALNITKAGNGEGLRVAKTSGSGNAVTITGGTLSAEAGQFSGDLQTSTRISATSGSNAITITPNVGGTENRIETTGTLPLALVSAAAITMAAGGTTPQITLATTGAVTLTGALNGTSGTFSSNFYVSGGTNTNVGNGIHLYNESNFAQAQLNGATGSIIDFSTSGTDFLGRIIYTNSSNSMQFHTNSAGTAALTLASTGAATFSSSVTATGNAATTSALYVNNGVGASGTAQYYAEFGNGAGFVGTRFFRGNGISGLAGGGMTIDSFDGFGIRLNQLGGSGGSFNVLGGNVGIGTASPTDILHLNRSGADVYNAIHYTNPNSTADFYVGIGGSSAPNSNLANNAYLYNAAASAIVIATSDTERMRITSDGYTRLSASSGGIQFNGDTAAANALDDYEEGTWTMGISFGGASVGVTTSSNTGTYTKIGREVTVNGIIVLTNKGTSTGVARVTGLPFVPNNSLSFYSSIAIRVSNVSSNGFIQGYVEVGLNTIRIESINLLGSRSDLFDNNFINTSDVMISFSYFV